MSAASAMPLLSVTREYVHTFSGSVPDRIRAHLQRQRAGHMLFGRGQVIPAVGQMPGVFDADRLQLLHQAFRFGANPVKGSGCPADGSMVFEEIRQPATDHHEKCPAVKHPVQGAHRHREHLHAMLRWENDGVFAARHSTDEGQEQSDGLLLPTVGVYDHHLIPPKPAHQPLHGKIGFDRLAGRIVGAFPVLADHSDFLHGAFFPLLSFRTVS